MNETIKKIDAYLEQFVGSTMEQIIMQEAKREIEKLIKERDDARTLFCMNHPLVVSGDNEARDVARRHGWDCFKENNK